jgi:hypothetical protein
VPNPETQRIYSRILTIANAPEFHSTGWKLLDVQDSGDHTNSDLIAYAWQSDSGKKLVIVNLGAATASGRVYLKDDLLSASSVVLNDLLNDRSYQRKIADLRQWGLFIKLDGFAAHIFELKQS